MVCSCLQPALTSVHGAAWWPDLNLSPAPAHETMAVMGNSAPDPETPLSEVGEFEAIALVTARFEQGDQVLVPPGDDAAQVRSASGKPLLTTDVLVDARHFRRDW